MWNNLGYLAILGTDGVLESQAVTVVGMGYLTVLGADEVLESEAVAVIHLAVGQSGLSDCTLGKEKHQSDP